MDSWISGPPDGASAPASSCSDAHTGRAAASWPLQGALLDGSSPLQVRAIQAPPTVQLAGDIDEDTYPDLAEVLAAVARTGQRRVRVDLAGVEYCDLAGLRAIITVADGQGNNGQGRAEQGLVEQGPVEHGPVEHGPVEHGPVEHGPVEQVILVHVPEFLRSVLQVLGWDSTHGLIVEDEAP